MVLNLQNNMNVTKSFNSSKNTTKKLFLVFSLVIFSSLFLVNCTEDSKDLLLGEDYIDSQTDITLVDTFDVELSTVKFDTVKASGTGRILLGELQNDVFGEIHSNSYLEVGVPESFYLVEEDVYDSLTFALTYNGYYLGDTTKSQRISVHHLTENIEFEDDKDYLSAKTQFNYDPEPLGSTVFNPYPFNRERDSVNIKLDDELGQELFDMLYDKSFYLDNNEIFIRNFYGLALIADEAYEGSLIGFNGNENEAAIILHTTRWGTSKLKIDYVFPITNISQQFNNISYDYQGTPLEGIGDQEHKLPSTESDDLAFIQGGVGLTIRADFPSLERIMLRERGTVMKAELVLAPANTNVYDYDLPSDLAIYEVNRLNYLTSSAITGSVLTIDDLYNEKTYYTFNITNYIKAQIDNNYIDPDKGLLITLPGSVLSASFERLLIDTQNDNTQLKIYYMTY